MTSVLFIPWNGHGDSCDKCRWETGLVLPSHALPTYRGEKKQQLWLGHKMSLSGICKEAFLKIKDSCERKISNTLQREKKIDIWIYCQCLITASLGKC